MDKKYWKKKTIDHNIKFLHVDTLFEKGVETGWTVDRYEWTTNKAGKMTVNRLGIFNNDGNL